MEQLGNTLGICWTNLSKKELFEQVCISYHLQAEHPLRESSSSREVISHISTTITKKVTASNKNELSVVSYHKDTNKYAHDSRHI
ncbi:hypothetical protein BRADI_1g39318v3 [Brachypodium distachyon]|uniref:Uncharacterized protein n=1 Tax=Brachypodium distachyon TaxID=15368 RepID=A0A0Q3L4W3_BRADI|nr:hypothetical protein BRADI_1g39318v3 [Brachypodium distachyon]